MVFFMLVVIVPVCLGAGFVSQLRSASFTDRIVTSITAQISTPVAAELYMEPVVTLLEAVQYPLVCVFLFILGGSALTFFLFIRYFVAPMDNMAVMARRIAVDSCVEIDRIGESFNDLSTNFQEVILLVWNYTQEYSAFLDRMIENAAHYPDDNFSLAIRQDIVSMLEKSQGLKEMINSFELYDVYVEENRAIAATEPWRTSG